MVVGWTILGAIITRAMIPLAERYGFVSFERYCLLKLNEGSTNTRLFYFYRPYYCAVNNSMHVRAKLIYSTSKCGSNNSLRYGDL